jgi:hypothetical protein
MLLSILEEVMLNYFYCSPFRKSQSISFSLEDAYRAVVRRVPSGEDGLPGGKLYIVGENTRISEILLPTLYWKEKMNRAL